MRYDSQDTITLLMICGMTDIPDLIILVHDVARLLRYEVDRRASAHGMTRAQWIILVWLTRRPGLSQKELSEILEVEPITVARLIDRLESRGMVERRPDPKDRRIWRLHLLPPSEPVVSNFHEECADIHRMATTDISSDVEKIMIEGLTRMKATLTIECRHGTTAPERSDVTKAVA